MSLHMMAHDLNDKQITYLAHNRKNVWVQKFPSLIRKLTPNSPENIKE